MIRFDRWLLSFRIFLVISFHLETSFFSFWKAAFCSCFTFHVLAFLYSFNIQNRIFVFIPGWTCSCISFHSQGRSSPCAYLIGQKKKGPCIRLRRCLRWREDWDFFWILTRSCQLPTFCDSECFTCFIWPWFLFFKGWKICSGSKKGGCSECQKIIGERLRLRYFCEQKFRFSSAHYWHTAKTQGPYC